MKTSKLTLILAGSLALVSCSTLSNSREESPLAPKTGDLAALYSGDVHPSHKQESAEYRKQVDRVEKESRIYN